MWWSPVFLMLLVASVRAEADADPEPSLPLVYQHYVPSWAAQQFGTPEEIASAAALFSSQRGEGYSGIPGGFGFLPPRAPPSPLLAIRDVRAPTAAIEELRKPAVQVLRHPSYVVYPPPVVFHPIHIRVPADQKDAVPIPVTAPASLSFASQHTAQLPYITSQGSESSLFNLYPIPLAAPHYSLLSQPAQDPEEEAAATPEEEDEDAAPNYIWLPRFPTELPGLMSLRGVDDEPVIPAGIVQATQPTFTKVVFRNDKAHPSLLDKMPIRDGPVISV
ncbi:uncharacterized protein [Panulirus ornatus]|uniref:uncharacterized protein n=1 Tax=Panulirus ornatus TaxID=150431 RepID=UPI003A8458EF